MAQIDIKNATVWIRDGYDGPGGTPLVNNMAGYAMAATTMVVNGFVGAVAVGDKFSVVGSTGKRHTITAHSETTSNTTSITFTPGLAGAVLDDAVITMLPHEIEVTIGEGNLTYTEKRNMVYTKNRGSLDTVKEGDEEPVEVKLDATWEFIKADSSETPTIEDVLKKRGEASTWESSSSDACEPYAVDIVIEYVPPCSNVDDEIITLNDFRYEEFAHDLRQGQFSISGKCNITEASVSRENALSTT